MVSGVCVVHSSARAGEATHAAVHAGVVQRHAPPGPRNSGCTGGRWD